jgi:hypothetical protein
LVVSPRPEVFKPLLKVLEAFSTNPVCCSTRAEAEEVLGHQAFEVVFCDEYWPDGSYADLIHSGHLNEKSLPFSEEGSERVLRKIQRDARTNISLASLPGPVSRNSPGSPAISRTFTLVLTVP